MQVKCVRTEKVEMQGGKVSILRVPIVVQGNKCKLVCGGSVEMPCPNPLCVTTTSPWWVVTPWSVAYLVVWWKLPIHG